MLIIIQFALGIAFIVLLILALCDAIKGTLIIFSGLVLLAIGYTLKGIAIAKRIRSGSDPAVRPGSTRKVPTWKIVPQ